MNDMLRNTYEARIVCSFKKLNGKTQKELQKLVPRIKKIFNVYSKPLNQQTTYGSKEARVARVAWKCVA